MLRAGWGRSIVGVQVFVDEPSIVTCMSRLERITSDPEICHGQPVVRGLRYPVRMLLELLSSGMTFDEILDDYEDLERDDLLAALESGALAVGGHTVPLGAA
jgi:uncharacterized protein (DUF433 family)